MRVGIIAIAKGEENYIREWVEHHRKLGFDIIVADNDDTLLLPDIIGDAVTVENYCGVSSVQVKAYTELYQKYQEDYDWLLFIDIDEFVMLDEHYASIADFLKDFDCDVVRLSEKHFSDGDYRVVERFKEPYYTNLDTFCKSFINTRVELNGRKIYGHSIYDDTLDARNALGDKCENFNQHTQRIVYERAWINHYPTKTIGEYIRQKYKRGGANGNPGRYTNWEKYFFRTNRKTDEKIAYANNLIKELYGNGTSDTSKHRQGERNEFSRHRRNSIRNSRGKH